MLLFVGAREACEERGDHALLLQDGEEDLLDRRRLLAEYAAHEGFYAPLHLDAVLPGKQPPQHDLPALDGVVRVEPCKERVEEDTARVLEDEDMPRRELDHHAAVIPSRRREALGHLRRSVLGREEKEVARAHDGLQVAHVDLGFQPRLRAAHVLDTPPLLFVAGRFLNLAQSCCEGRFTFTFITRFPLKVTT